MTAASPALKICESAPAGKQASDGPIFKAEDWRAFLTLSDITRRAGVPRRLLAPLAAKELCDNALDACDDGTAVRVEDMDVAVTVADDGPGIPGTDEDIAALFSVARPMISTKRLRLPTRGALGNGLRVVAGLVLATGGMLRVATRGRMLEITPHDDGTATARRIGPAGGEGTRITVSLPGLDHEDPHDWTARARVLARGGPTYRGKSSPHWYNTDAFFQLCQAADGMTARALVAELDGCSGAKAGRIAADFAGRAATSLSRDECEELLDACQDAAAMVKPRRLGRVGKLDGLLGAHAVVDGFVFVDGLRLPTVVEAWALPAEDEAGLSVHVNRSPMIGRAELHKHKGAEWIYRAGELCAYARLGAKDLEVWVNIQTPWVPLLSDGKLPDLTPWSKLITTAIEKAARGGQRIRRDEAGDADATVKDRVFEVMPGAIAHESANGTARFNTRNLFYTVRALLEDPALNWDDFASRIVKAWEAEHGRIPGMFRNARGVLVHPHTGEEMAVGTLTVERYERPAWTFRSILFVEKEGRFQTLQAARWPERWDCALLTSQGYATEAVKDLLDLLDASDEEITIYCLHDADGPGTVICETLTEGVKARVINLGLDPWEALERGLDPETFEAKKKRIPVAEYVRQCDGDWEEWLQTHRVELNQISAADFVAWLDAKMLEHGAEKLIPPDHVLEQRYREQLWKSLVDDEAAKYREVVEAAARERMKAMGADVERKVAALPELVRDALDDEPEQSWAEAVDDEVTL